MMLIRSFCAGTGRAVGLREPFCESGRAFDQHRATWRLGGTFTTMGASAGIDAVDSVDTR